MKAATRKSKIADEIRKALIASDKSRYAISQESGVDQAALHRFVNGADLRIGSLEKVAQALGLEIVVQAIGRKRKGS
jgi:hypothetical protein